ncbi:MAG: sarcosine oxidase subunit gamma [Gammaproteobacteria bacterium]|nr:sarcosine oxidase subunit gamma [Gammaproteobacteria bacterium]
MADRASALDGHLVAGVSGNVTEDGPGVVLELLRDLVLHQVAAWPDTLESCGVALAEVTGADALPGPGMAIESGDVAVLRTEPLKWWIVGTAALPLDPSAGAVLDLSHSRTRIRITGPDAAALLNRFLPLDLRENAFPRSSVASSALHHVGVTLWRSAAGYELFMPRGFALSCWEVLMETARQFGVEVRQSVLPGAGT